MFNNHLEPVADHLVWSRFKNGDDESLNVLLSRYFRPMLHYGSKFTKDRFLVEDVIQDLFLDFLEKRNRLGDPVSVKNYLLKCLRNNLIRALKAQGQQSDIATDQDLIVESENMEKFLIALDESAELSSKINGYFALLTSRQQECLFLRFYQDLSNDEIAQIMGINKQSVSNLLARSISILKENWVFILIYFQHVTC
ncbi:MAG TPA: sigma-70 family RNA polymerase sigma factor [Dyadobacter sp.]|nr:sigma-70 family RNA polymerase sigma factor [Dyadobacter sp.]